ncbi:hypothetical protein RRG08_023868 [Elysia crispata]|uniref:Doublecortin domain-containing protein n=1 Tax=Elysia crispata TaxID=231223 RepID=A0AAE1AUI0_9GAST|nr:hypothetical protein RRG08_023868 [Elysia crispata]
MAETKFVGGIDPDYRMEDHHSNHNGFGSISPDDHHDNNNVDTLLSNQREKNNNSGQSSLDHNMNGPAMETQPRYLMDSNRGKISNFYVNGDKFFPGRKIVHNPKYFKDLPHYLDYLTDKLEPRFGAIRKICTPKHGHRVLSLQDIRENCDYVVVGAERFKPFQ